MEPLFLCLQPTAWWVYRSCAGSERPAGQAGLHATTDARLHIRNAGRNTHNTRRRLFCWPPCPSAPTPLGQSNRPSSQPLPASALQGAATPQLPAPSVLLAPGSTAAGRCALELARALHSQQNKGWNGGVARALLFGHPPCTNTHRTLLDQNINNSLDGIHKVQ